MNENFTRTPKDGPAINREEWLTWCVALVKRLLDAPIKDDIRITCGWPSKGALAKRRVNGECWSPDVSADGTTEIFISPLLDNGLEVAAVVAHELLHATGLKGHRANFAKAAQRLGLDGPATSTIPGEVFEQRITSILEILGPYPHARIDPKQTERKKQTTRLLKVSCASCENEDDPYIVRMSAATLERGAPICPIHNEGMRLEEATE